MVMLALHLMVACHFMIRIISLATLPFLWLGSSTNFLPMCTKTSLMILDDCWISWINLSLSVVYKDRLFMELMCVSKSSDILSCIWTFIVAVFFSVNFLPLPFYPIISHMSTLFHFNRSDIDSLIRIKVILMVGSSFASFTFFWLSIIIEECF